MAHKHLPDVERHSRPDPPRPEERGAHARRAAVATAAAAVMASVARQDAPTSILEAIVEQARLATDAEFVAAGVGTDPRRRFSPWTCKGAVPEEAATLTRLPRPVGLLGEVARSGRAIRLRDLREHPAFKGLPAEGGRTVSFLGVPIAFAGRPLGALCLLRRCAPPEHTGDRPSHERLIERGPTSHGELTLEDQHCATTLAELAGSAMEISRSTRALRDAVHARDDLLCVVSHDLRGSLLGIRLHAHLMQKGLLVKAPELSRSADAIVGTTVHMGHVLDDLLRAAAIETGTFDIDPQPEHVLPVVHQLIEMTAPIADASSVELRTSVPAMLPRIWCDREQVLRVLCNLVNNAIKFGREHGTIRIAAQTGKSGVRFSVADNGPGIAEDSLPHVFERYWTSDPLGRRGIGLGLFIAKGIVLAHGGRIWVHSRPGAGSTFCFTVPFAAQA